MGFASGAIGIGVTLLLIIPVNLIIEAITGIAGIAALPWMAGLILVLISMLLTFVAGLIPPGLPPKRIRSSLSGQNNPPEREASWGGLPCRHAVRQTFSPRRQKSAGRVSMTGKRAFAYKTNPPFHRRNLTNPVRKGIIN